MDSPSPSVARSSVVPAETLIFVGAGANLGERVRTLRGAFEALGKLERTWQWRSSPLYETPPVAVAAAPGEAVPAFLNAVFAATTTLPAPEVLAALQAIEQRAGREHKGGHRSRTLDLDLLAYGDTVLSESGLELPHPRLTERWFVLKPLCDLAPRWQHPHTGHDVTTLLAALEARTPGDDEAIGRGWCYAERIA